MEFAPFNHSTQQFREILKTELLKRCSRNPRYSLRAFAKSLNVEHSMLSKLIHGKRPLTRKMISKLCEGLGVTPTELKLNGSAENDYSQLTADQMVIASHWRHFAILELFKIKGVKQGLTVISKKLNLSTIETSDALDRLERLGFIEKNQKGYRLSKDSTTMFGSTDWGIKKKYQKQILELALEALDEIPREERSQTSITMAVNSKKLEEVRIHIKTFQRSICDFLQQGELDSVYQMGVSLFPLTRK